ncbi:hypothetical protein P3S68_033913 [Capsicum galapagoense]
MERLKNEENQTDLRKDLIEEFQLVLAFICTYVQLSYSDLEQFEDVMTVHRREVKDLLRSILYDVDINVAVKYDLHHVLRSLRDNINRCISSHHRPKCATMTDEQLNFLLLNLHYLSIYLSEQIFPLVTQYESLQKVCGNMKDFHGLIVNGYVEREIVKYVLPQLQRMAERVGLFLWDDLTYVEYAHLLMKIIPIELEVMQICYTNMKESTSAEVERFIKQLLEASPEILREYLIHLQEHMVSVITASTSGARNIHVIMEFLLIILTDMPTDFIHHDKLFDLLARVGALIREVSTLVRDVEEQSRNKESTNGTNRAALDLLKNIELLKEDLKYVYLKAPDSYQYSNSYSIALIKEEIGVLKEDIEFISSSFVNIEQRLYKDLWARVLDVAYVATDVIDSIIVRDNGLVHLIFSLPITMKKIRLIKEDVSRLPEKIPKNKSLIVVNSRKNPVERKSLTTRKIIVGFKEETNWLISKLTSGPKDLDVISITGMPGSGKTTLAYRVYNDISVCSRFDLRAWCTVDQEYDEKKLLVKLFNQVTGSDLNFSEDIDVADMLRRQLFGKRYLIVLDDVRIILTTRQKEVAFHGKGNADPLNLRLLGPEECWELIEKRAFGKESCPDELLHVGKEIAENCKGLPSVADLIAGVIAGREKEKSVWLEVRNNLNSFILNTEVDVMKDTAVDREILKMYWCAEGFVEQTGMKCLEEEMEIYLDKLVSSSLVIAFSEIDLMPRILNIDYDKEHFGPNNFMEDHLSDLSHLRDLRLLRMLQLEPYFMMVKDSLLNEICMLNHLRFLPIGTEVKSLPSSFSNLWNLDKSLPEKNITYEVKFEQPPHKTCIDLSFSALRRDVVNVQDFMERLKNEEGQNAVDMADQIEELKFQLEEFKDEMSDSRQRVENLLRQILVGCQYNMDHVLPSLMDNIDDCISSCHHSTSSATMTDEQLNFLLLNLHHISMHLAEQIFPLETQYEILQKVSGNMKDFHGLIVNGCIEHKIVQYVLPQLQRMAERVGLFLWNDQTYGDSRLFKLAHLLMKIIPIELEVMQICHTNLKASPSVEVGRFIKQLLETSLEVLREYLIHLQEHMVTVITASTSGARNIHVMIEFPLIVLTEMPKDFIHHEKLFDLLARVGALIREVSTLVHDLEEKSRNEESTDETTLDLLEENLNSSRKISKMII